MKLVQCSKCEDPVYEDEYCLFHHTKLMEEARRLKYSEAQRKRSQEQFKLTSELEKKRKEQLSTMDADELLKLVGFTTDRSKYKDRPTKDEIVQMKIESKYINVKGKYVGNTKGNRSLNLLDKKNKVQIERLRALEQIRKEEREKELELLSHIQSTRNKDEIQNEINSNRNSTSIALAWNRLGIRVFTEPGKDSDQRTEDHPNESTRERDSNQ